MDIIFTSICIHVVTLQTSPHLFPPPPLQYDWQQSRMRWQIEEPEKVCCGFCPSCSSSTHIPELHRQDECFSWAGPEDGGGWGWRGSCGRCNSLHWFIVQSFNEITSLSEVHLPCIDKIDLISPPKGECMSACAFLRGEKGNNDTFTFKHYVL